MHPALPGEIHPLFRQSGPHHRQRMHPVRPVLRGLPSEREGNRGRAGKGQGAAEYILLFGGVIVIALIALQIYSSYLT